MPELFQVVKDPPPLGSSGLPIFCGNPSAWLGRGVYFWESFIENARKYGDTHCQSWGRLNHTKGYKIYKTIAISAHRCLNLVDGVADLRHVLDFYQKLQKKNLNKRPVRLFELLGMMRKDPIFRTAYDSVRALPDGGGLTPMYLEYTLPEDGTKARFFFTPPIQVCFWQNAPKLSMMIFVE